MTAEAKGHLRWCIEQAMARVYHGQRGGAVSGFLQDVQRHPETSWVAEEPEIQSNLLIAYDKGKEIFEQVLKSFYDQEGARDKVLRLIS